MFGLFKKQPQPQTFEEYVQFFDNIPNERRNIYLKYIEAYSQMEDALFMRYAQLSDFYDYQNYRLENIARNLKAPRGEGSNLVHFVNKFYGFHHISTIKHELVEKNGEVHFNLCRFANKPKYFENDDMFVTINPNAGTSEKNNNLTILVSNSKDKSNSTFFYVDDKTETVWNVNQYCDETNAGIHDINEAGKFISKLFEDMRNFSPTTIQKTQDKEALEVLDRLLAEAKELNKETKAPVANEETKDKK